MCLGIAKQEGEQARERSRIKTQCFFCFSFLELTNARAFAKATKNITIFTKMFTPSVTAGLVNSIPH